MAMAVTLGLLGIATGCTSALADARRDFARGRYGDARLELVALEQESQRWDDARRAEYALYRGLTHGALGDRAAAGVWLQEARAIDAAHPGALGAEDRTRLALAAESLAIDGAAANGEP